MHRLIVGTAGHVDHGKTRLIEALTGIDCDRWQEEKRRGITIDLGFAHLHDEDVQIGFVDVPGHERFLHNALAGLGGVRLILLVVAADEGVKPQTLEHLAICSLLEIPSAVVALTKTDLVSEDLLELAQEEVAEVLADSPFRDAPIVMTSATTGEGIAELRDLLLSKAREHAVEVDLDRPFRLPVDRAFVLTGLGVITTGTLVAGSLSVGDTVELAPGGRSAKVRGLQVHSASRDAVDIGERVAVQLGGIDHQEIARGDQLVEPGAYSPSASWCSRFRLLPEAPQAVEGWTPVRVHLFSAETVGRFRPLEGPLEPGREGLVEVRLANPVVSVRGDRWIARRPSPPDTLGGGVLLDPSWAPTRPTVRSGRAARLNGEDEAAVELWIENSRETGLPQREIGHRLGRNDRSTQALLESCERILPIPGGQGGERRWLHQSVFEAVAHRGREVLKQFFDEHRMDEWIPKAEFVARVLPNAARPLAPLYLEHLADAKVLSVDGDRIRRPGHTAQLSGDESQLAKSLLAQYEKGGLTPPAPQAVQRQLGAKPQIVDGVIRYLVQQGKLTQLPGGLLFATSSLHKVCQELVESAEEEFAVSEFKERYGLSRKWAIPILEHLDSVGVTRRVGDRRQIVRSP